MVQNLVAGDEELAVLLATNPLRGRHGRLRYANPQGISADLPLRDMAVRGGIRRGWQQHPVPEVAGEGCREAWAYTAYKLYAGIGGMTGCGLILLPPMHSRTLQRFPRTAGIQRHATGDRRHLSQSSSYSLSSTWSNVLKNAHTLIRSPTESVPMGSFPS